MIQKEKNTKKKTTFLFSEDLFPAAYIEYMDIKNKSVKSAPAKTGKTIFKWHKVKFHHISVKGNKIDYLIHDGIVICSFPFGKDRNEIYEFLDKYWEDRIEPFVKYVEARRKSESSIKAEEV